MKNYEKYADEIREYEGYAFCKDFILPYILKSEKCAYMSCDQCRMLQTIWLLEECKEPEKPETDWSKVKVDTPILVRQTKDKDREWERRHFAKYENGKVYAWDGGGTSWTKEYMTAWNYAKLAEGDEGGVE